MLEFRDELQAEVFLCARGHRQAAKMKKPSLEQMKSLAGHWEHYTALYDRMNEPLPERYRKRLADRFYPGLIQAPSESEAK